jgi:hypothetical protein
MTMNGAIPVDHRRLRQILWFAMLGSVLLLGGVMFFLSEMAELPPGDPELAQMIFYIGLASLLGFPAIRLLGGLGGAGRSASPRFRQSDQEQQVTARLLMGWAAAEMPAVFGLIHLVLGGSLVQALMLWVGALILMGMARPETAREI